MDTKRIALRFEEAHARVVSAESLVFAAGTPYQGPPVKPAGIVEYETVAPDFNDRGKIRYFLVVAEHVGRQHWPSGDDGSFPPGTEGVVLAELTNDLDLVSWDEDARTLDSLMFEHCEAGGSMEALSASFEGTRNFRVRVVFSASKAPKKQGQPMTDDRPQGFDPLENLRKRAREKIEQEKYEDAEKFLGAVLKDNPEDREARAVLAQLSDLIKKRDTTRFLQEAQNALDHGHFDQVLKLAERARQLDPSCSKSAGELVERATAGRRRRLAIKLRLAGVCACVTVLVGLVAFIIHFVSGMSNRSRMSAGNQLLSEGKWFDAAREYSAVGDARVDITERDRKRQLAQSLTEIGTREERGPLEALALYKAFAKQHSSEPWISAVQSRASQLETSAYTRLVETAKELLGKKMYVEARKVADEAARLSPARTEAPELLTRINNLRNEEQFQQYIQSADRALASKDYRAAAEAADRAHALKAADPHVGEIIRQVKEGTFQETMASARSAINDKLWRRAADQARSALAQRPDTREAADIIKTAEAEERRAKLAEYNSHLTKAKEALVKENYQEAIRESQSALAVLPDEGEAQEILNKSRVSQHVSALEGRDNRKALAAIRNLGDMGPGAKEGVALLAKALMERENYGQEYESISKPGNVLRLREESGLPLAIVEALGKIGKDASGAASAVEWFRANMEHWAEHGFAGGPSKEVHREAMKVAEATLKRVGPAKESFLIDALKDKDWGTRWGAARVLGLQGATAKEVVAALVTALKDDKELRVKVASAEALGNIGGEARDAVPVLARALIDRSNYYETSGRVYLRGDNDLPLIVVEALGKIGKDASGAVSAVEWFRANMEHWAEHGFAGGPNKDEHRDSMKAAAKTLEKVR